MVFNKIKEYCISECKFIGKRLKLAILVFVTFSTVCPVFGKEKLNNMFAGISYFKGIGINFHPFRYRGGTGCNQSPRPFLLNYTNTAITCNAKVIVVTQGRNVYFQFLSRCQDCCSRLNGYLLVIYK
jgi:hypothetical protein